MKKFPDIGVVLLLALAISGCPKKERMPEKIPEDISRYAQAADFIFRGEVMALNTSTVDAEDPSAMGIVAVEEILAGNEFYRQYKGEKITVIFRDPGKMKTGGKKIFFTRGKAIGESLEAQEIGILDADDKTYQTVRGQIDTARRKGEDDTLASRLRNTTVVITGKIVSIKPAGIKPPFDSEHWPDWMVATVEVKEAIKGQSGAQRTFLFPQSTDEMWRVAPQFKEGDEGVFLLREKNTPLLDEKEMSLTDPRDFLSMNQAPRVKALAK